jgi:hypothetical protein
MTVKQVKEAEDIVNAMAAKNQVVHTQNAALASAKAIQGLRAVFDEVGTFTCVSWLCAYYRVPMVGEKVREKACFFKVRELSVKFEIGQGNTFLFRKVREKSGNFVIRIAGDGGNEL